jgi:mono/diheme cytochrome c family protein
MLLALGCAARRGPQDLAAPQDVASRQDAAPPQSVAAPAVPVAPLAPQRSIRDGVYTEAQSRRGEAVYFTSCSQCHKPTMTGLEVVPPLVGEAFLSRWNTRTAGDLFEWIRKAMPFGNTPKLSDPEYADVLAYILSRNGFRAGEAELAADFATLAEIRMAPAAD